MVLQRICNIILRIRSWPGSYVPRAVPWLHTLSKVQNKPKLGHYLLKIYAKTKTELYAGIKT